ncbi:hypothetical protein V8F33_005890 [Rhypophila sp. PSN 637]
MSAHFESNSRGQDGGESVPVQSQPRLIIAELRVLTTLLSQLMTHPGLTSMAQLTRPSPWQPTRSLAFAPSSSLMLFLTTLLPTSICLLQHLHHLSTTSSVFHHPQSKMASANTGSVGESPSMNVAMAGQTPVLDDTILAWIDGVTEPRDEAIPSIEQDDTPATNRPDHETATKETARRPITRSITRSMWVDQKCPALIVPARTVKNVSTPRRKSPKAPARNESDRGPRVRLSEPPMRNQRGTLSSPMASFPTIRSSLGQMRVSRRNSYATSRARRRRLLAIAEPLANLRDTHTAGKNE